MDDLKTYTSILPTTLDRYSQEEPVSVNDVKTGWQDGIGEAVPDINWLLRVGQRLPFIPLEPIPLSVDEVKRIVGKYLVGLQIPDLAIDEVQVYESNTFARIVEKNTGMGAFEVLIDPWTLMVYPTPGATITWNRKYQPGPEGISVDSSREIKSSLRLSPINAIRIAQAYLDENLVGSIASQSAYPFYGYYSIEITQGDLIIGKVDVNGETGEVYPQLNQGALIEAS